MKGTKEACIGKIVGDVVERGREDQNVALADLLVEQQRRLVGELGDHAGVAGFDADGLVELDVFPAIVLQDRGVRRIEPGGGLEALAFAAGVARLLNACRRTRAPWCGRRRCGQGDQHAAAAAHVIAQVRFRSRRAGCRHRRARRRRTSRDSDWPSWSTVTGSISKAAWPEASSAALK